MDLQEKLKLLGAEISAKQIISKTYETLLLDNNLKLTDFSRLEQELITNAALMREGSNSPYSKFSVGSCILGSDNRFYFGANIETADYHGLHAEESAIANMFRHNVRTILAVAVALECRTEWQKPMPCGGCRQKIYEFSLGNIPVIGVRVNWKNDIWGLDFTSIDYLLPAAFGRRNL